MRLLTAFTRRTTRARSHANTLLRKIACTATAAFVLGGVCLTAPLNTEPANAAQEPAGSDTFTISNVASIFTDSVVNDSPTQRTYPGIDPQQPDRACRTRTSGASSTTVRSWTRSNSVFQYAYMEKNNPNMWSRDGWVKPLDQWGTWPGGSMRDGNGLEARPVARVLASLAGLLELHDADRMPWGENPAENGIIFYNNEIDRPRQSIPPWMQTAMGFKPNNARHGLHRPTLPAGHAARQQPPDFQQPGTRHGQGREDADRCGSAALLPRQPEPAHPRRRLRHAGHRSLGTSPRRRTTHKPRSFRARAAPTPSSPTPCATPTQTGQWPPMAAVAGSTANSRDPRACTTRTDATTDQWLTGTDRVRPKRRRRQRNTTTSTTRANRATSTKPRAGRRHSARRTTGRTPSTSRCAPQPRTTPSPSQPPPCPTPSGKRTACATA